MRNRNIELAVTRLGGHMAPVTFYRDTARSIKPYYISPWQGEGLKIDDPVLVPLRGDFFCLPFGDNITPLGNEKHICHGEPATKKWTFRSLKQRGEVTALTLSMKTKIRPGRITKTIAIREGHNVIYSRHLLEGFDGPTSLGHHPTLAVPEAEGSLLVSSSPFKFGMTCPSVAADPAEGNYNSFERGAKFTNLSRVPLVWKHEPFGDCTAFPVRPGFFDVLALFKRQSPAPAWMTAVNSEAGYLWFSFKDASVLPTTVFWISNRGLHSAPFFGRDRCLGLEDVCGFLAEGLAESIRPNAATCAGIKTAIRLSTDKPTAVNYIQGVVKVPRGFGRVRKVEFAPGKATFVSEKGKKANVQVQHEFLASGEVE